MAKVEKTITINAPVEKVFGYFDEPRLGWKCTTVDVLWLFELVRYYS